MKHLVLGGARSGKSRYAEELALASSKPLIYIATAQGLDGEMQQRISHHQQQRDARWQTVEEPIELASCLRTHTRQENCILVDCLTLWLTNILLAGDDVLHRERSALLEALPALAGHIILVSNEVGMGIVAADPLSRRFVDEAGRLHQLLAQQCEHVTFVTAGLPMALK